MINNYSYQATTCNFTFPGKKNSKLATYFYFQTHFYIFKLSYGGANGTLAFAFGYTIYDYTNDYLSNMIDLLSPLYTN